MEIVTRQPAYSTDFLGLRGAGRNFAAVLPHRSPAGRDGQKKAAVKAAKIWGQNLPGPRCIEPGR